MTRRRSLISGFSLVTFISLLFIALTLSAPLASASSSPSKDTEIICSPTDPNDCYPKLFVPLEEFQVVREGQEIPSGLHVRMNVYTGQKEAKIYDPTEAEDPLLSGLPVDGALVVVESEDGEEGSEETMKVPAGAPKYEAVGKIKEPQEPGNLDDYSSFTLSMEKLKKSVNEGAVEGLTGSLESLEDLSHDIYYGLKITEDEDALKALFCLMTPARGAEESASERQAASILGAATQNNPSALAQVVKRWSAIGKLKCQGTKSQLGKALYNRLVTSNPRTTKAKVAAMNGLVKDKGIKTDFLSKGGMSRFLEVILQEGSDWEGTKTKVGHFVLDNFLDESMGAVLGVWPPAPKKGHSFDCEGADRLNHGCWAYHVGSEAVTHKMDEAHWSQEMYFKLTNKNVGVEEHVEL